MGLSFGFVQPRLMKGDGKGAMGRCLALARSIADADFIVLPEMANIGYRAWTRDQALRAIKQVGGKHVEALRDFTAEHNNTIVSGEAMEEKGLLYDCSVVVSCGKVTYRYRKRHLFGHEIGIFTPGERGPDIVRVGKAAISSVVCLDSGYTSELEDLKGRIDALLVPAALSLPKDSASYGSAGTGYNKVLSNWVGSYTFQKGRIGLTGGSKVVDKDGNVVHQGPSRSEEAYLVTL